MHFEFLESSKSLWRQGYQIAFQLAVLALKQIIQGLGYFSIIS